MNKNKNETSEIGLVGQPTNGEMKSDSDSPASTFEGSADVKKKAAKQYRVESLEELVVAIYDGKFKRKSLNKKERTAVMNAPSFSLSQDEVLQIVNADQFLSKTRYLMLLGVQTQGLSYKLITLARNIMLQHQLFSSQSMREVLNNVPEAMQVGVAIDTILESEPSSINPGNSEATMTKKDWEMSKVNAVHCLLILRKEIHGASLRQVHQLLQDKLWAKKLSTNKNDGQKLAALLNNRDTQATLESISFLRNELAEQKRQADAAVRREERTSAELESSQESLTKTNDRLTKALSDNERLKIEVQEREQSNRTNIEHLNDDYEQMRGNVLRKLKKELSLLEEGLHALKKETPKVHVMIDHAERAIDGLKEEVNRLRGGK
jgi:hypothetical protein